MVVAGSVEAAGGEPCAYDDVFRREDWEHVVQRA